MKTWRFPTMGAVVDFHEAFGLPRRETPSADISDELADLRIDLLIEEVDELEVAVKAGDLLSIAQELADIVYIAYGTALTYGIDLDRVLAEVHRANMSKLDDQGKPIKRADGKVLKSDRYRPPDIQGVLNQQGEDR